jgi:hypothetical protein
VLGIERDLERRLGIEPVEAADPGGIRAPLPVAQREPHRHPAEIDVEPVRSVEPERPRQLAAEGLVKPSRAVEPEAIRNGPAEELRGALHDVAVARPSEMFVTHRGPHLGEHRRHVELRIAGEHGDQGGAE